MRQNSGVTEHRSDSIFVSYYLLAGIATIISLFFSLPYI
jgi:hypothetical protein